MICIMYLQVYESTIGSDRIKLQASSSAWTCESAARYQHHNDVMLSKFLLIKTELLCKMQRHTHEQQLAHIQGQNTTHVGVLKSTRGLTLTSASPMRSFFCSSAEGQSAAAITFLMCQNSLVQKSGAMLRSVNSDLAIGTQTQNTQDLFLPPGGVPLPFAASNTRTARVSQR